MFKILFAIFIVLHGLVHMLYFGQSWRVFELRPGMVWPDGAWAFSRLLGDETTRLLASVLLIVATVGFMVGGAGLLFEQDWWRPIVVGVAVFSTVLYILFWDGAWQNLDDKGGVGLLINLALLTAVLLWR